jgi:hypothetical protein
MDGKTGKYDQGYCLKVLPKKKGCEAAMQSYSSSEGMELRYSNIN